MSQDIELAVLVEHSVWGRGKVVEVSPPYVEVHFSSLAGSEHGPRRKLRLDAEQLSRAAVQTDPALDGVRVGPGKGTKPGPGSSVHSQGPSARPLDFAIAGFRARYPGLFQDPKLVDKELRYKRTAHETFVVQFGHGRGRKLLRSADFAKIAAILDELYHATNIPHRFEIMALHDGVKNAPAAGRVLATILDFVDSPGADTFEGLAEAIAGLPGPEGGSRVLTWPNVTILPFLADPSRFMVLKPKIARQMAARMSFELLYSASPKWHCYEALLRMSALLLDQLRPLGAKDYVDVQSFMWVTRVLE